MFFWATSLKITVISNKRNQIKCQTFTLKFKSQNSQPVLDLKLFFHVTFRAKKKHAPLSKNEQTPDNSSHEENENICQSNSKFLCYLSKTKRSENYLQWIVIYKKKIFFWCTGSFWLTFFKIVLSKIEWDSTLSNNKKCSFQCWFSHSNHLRARNSLKILNCSTFGTS